MFISQLLLYCSSGLRRAFYIGFYARSRVSDMSDTPWRHPAPQGDSPSAEYDSNVVMVVVVPQR